MAFYNRWWISPESEIVTVNTSTHISEIIAHPEKFGLTREYIEETYKAHGERLGLEGKAREEIMKKVMDLGWIRARDGNGLYMETSNLSRYKDTIYSAIKTFLSENLMGKFDPVTVVDYRTSEVIRGDSAGDVLRRVYTGKLRKLNIISL